MVEFRAENKTADTLNKIADEIDVSRSDLVLSMVKFALTNHDWARFGLTHKTIPLYKGNPMATKKPTPAQLAARQKFADMVRARAAAAKGKKMPRKNPMESALLHLSGTKYGQVKQHGHIFTAYVLQKVNTGIGEEMDLLDSKSFKTKSGAANWLAKNYGRKTNPRKKTVSQKISQLEHEGYPHKQSIAIALSEQRKGKVTRNPMMSASQLARLKKELQETERLLAKEIMNYSVKNQDEQMIDFYHKHIAKLKKALGSGKLEDVMKSVRKRNPSGEIPAYEITRNFKVLGIFQTKSDAIKAAQGISDATGKTIAVKPVQVLAGHFDR
jgi:hypothetical protein